MPSIYAPDFGVKPLHMDSHGNQWTEIYTFNPIVSAVVADKIYFGVIPAGVTITDARILLPVLSAGATMSLGFEPYDATLGPTANLTYWFTAQTLAAAGRFETASMPLILEFPVQIVGTVAGATIASKRIDLIFDGKMVGVK